MSLTSVAAPIWNQIARQRLQTPWARKAFKLDADGMVELMNQEYAKLTAEVGGTVASAYLDVKPLLLENQAISRFTQAQPMYRAALPEITSIQEAILIASQDHLLTTLQQKKLQKLLEADLNSAEGSS